MKLGHITDLHLRQHACGTVPGSVLHCRSMLERFSEALQRLIAEQVDHIAVTGDVLDVADAVRCPEYRDETLADLFLPGIRRDYEAVRLALDQTGIPYSIIPGNHDYWPEFNRVFPGATALREMEAGYRIVSYCDQEQADHIPFRQGAERQLMENALNDADSPPQIHLQHFLPYPPVDADYPYNYADAEAMARRYAESGKVLLSLSGHYHAGTGLLEHDGVNYSTAPTFGKPPFPTCLYTLRHKTVTMRSLCLPVPERQQITIPLASLIDESTFNRTEPLKLKPFTGAGENMLRLRKEGWGLTITTLLPPAEIERTDVRTRFDYLSHLFVEESGSPDAQPDFICSVESPAPEFSLDQLARRSSRKPPI